VQDTIFYILLIVDFIAFLAGLLKVSPALLAFSSGLSVWLSLEAFRIEHYEYIYNNTSTTVEAVKATVGEPLLGYFLSGLAMLQVVLTVVATIAVIRR